jgi:type I restriction enzyme S subunit
MLPSRAVLFTSRAPIGLVAIADVPVCTNQGFKSLVPGPDVDSAYLYWCLRRHATRIAATGSGSTFAEVSKEVVARFQIPLPPLAEQRRIVAVLDKADTLRRKRRESLRLLDEFLRSAFLEMFGDPVRNEKGWDVKPLGDVAEFVGGGTPSRSVNAYFTGEICWATAKDIQSENLFDTQEHITPPAIENSATKLVSPGTILIVVKSKVLMHRLPVAMAQVPTCFGQDLKGIVLRNGLSPIYVARHLRLGQSWLLSRARGANTEGLTLDHLRRLPLMLPPSDRIERYDRLERKYEATRKAFASQLAHSDSLFDSLAQRAFRGDL